MVTFWPQYGLSYGLSCGLSLEAAPFSNVNTVDVRREERHYVPLRGFAGHIDIAGRGSLETMASAIALAMVLRLPLVKAKMVIIGLFLKF